MKLFCRYPSPVGELICVCEENHLTGLFSAEHGDLSGGTEGDHPVLDLACRWLDRYFAGERPDPRELSVKAEGSEFRKQIWEMLLQIPYGRTVTYGELAGKLGRRMSAQAIGGAVGANPVWIVIPCHRVVGAGGRLTGYEGGLEMKAKLLELEARDTR